MIGKAEAIKSQVILHSANQARTLHDATGQLASKKLLQQQVHFKAIQYRE